MSWANCRASMETAIEALTPTTTTVGGARFVSVDHEQIEDRDGDDRAFAIFMDAPPAQVAHALEGADGWYRTQYTVAITYSQTTDRATDEARIAEDVAQIETALLTLGNHHANAYGPEAVGDTWFTTGLEVSQDSGFFVTLSGVLLHV